jgi:hypothetical protein
MSGPAARLTTEQHISERVRKRLRAALMVVLAVVDFCLIITGLPHFVCIG